MTPGQRSKQRWVASLAELEPDLVVDTGDNLAHTRAVPGVLAARRFRGTNGNRKYVALYHLAAPAVVESEEWKKARQSDWTSRLQPHFRDHLRLVLRRYARGA